MAVSTPPAYIQAGTYPASLDRLHQHSCRFLPTTANTTDVAARSGILGGQSGRQANFNMTNWDVTIGRFVAIIENTFTTNGGDYSVFNDTSQVLTVAASSPTTNRIDIIGVRVQDAFYSGAVNSADLVVVQGTPSAGTPADPALPNSFMPIVRVTVNAGTSTGILADMRKRTAAMGAVYSPFTGQLGDNGTMVGEVQILAASASYPARLRIWDGTTWRGVTPFAFDKPAQTGSGSLGVGGNGAVIMSQSVADPGYSYKIKAGGSLAWGVVAASSPGNLLVCSVTLDSSVYNVGNFAYGEQVSHSLGASFSQPTADAEGQHTVAQGAGTAHTVRLIARNSGGTTYTLPVAPATGLSVEVVPT